MYYNLLYASIAFIIVSIAFKFSYGVLLNAPYVNVKNITATSLTVLFLSVESDSSGDTLAYNFYDYR